MKRWLSHGKSNVRSNNDKKKERERVSGMHVCAYVCVCVCACVSLFLFIETAQHCVPINRIIIYTFYNINNSNDDRIYKQCAKYVKYNNLI